MRHDQSRAAKRRRHALQLAVNASKRARVTGQEKVIADAVERVLLTVHRREKVIAWYARELTAALKAVSEMQAELLRRRAS